MLEKFFKSFSVNAKTVALDIGSGPKAQNRFFADMVFGADLRANESENVFHVDLNRGKLPFKNEMFDYVTADNVLEHIMRVSFSGNETNYPFIELINEVFRVLKPGGVFFNIQPCFPAKEAFQDPTHVNIMTEDTMRKYFCESAWGGIYGFESSFEMLQEGWIGGAYFSFMKKSFNEPIKEPQFIQK